MRACTWLQLGEPHPALSVLASSGDPRPWGLGARRSFAAIGTVLCVWVCFLDVLDPCFFDLFVWFVWFLWFVCLCSDLVLLLCLLCNDSRQQQRSLVQGRAEDQARRGKEPPAGSSIP